MIVECLKHGSSCLVCGESLKTANDREQALKERVEEMREKDNALLHQGMRERDQYQKRALEAEAENASLCQQRDELVKQLADSRAQAQHLGDRLWNESCHAGAVDGDGGPAIPEPCDCRGCQAEYATSQVQARLTAFEQMEVRYLEVLGNIRTEAYGHKQWSFVVDQCARVLAQSDVKEEKP